MSASELNEFSLNHSSGETQNESPFLSIIQNLFDITYIEQILPDHTRQLVWNRCSNKSDLGYSLEELTSLSPSWRSICHPKENFSVSWHEKTLFAGSPHILEFKVITKDKQIFWLRDNAYPALSPSGTSVAKIYGGIEDITQRKIEEQKLKVHTVILNCFVSIQDEKRQIQSLLSELSSVLDWDIGSYWVLDSHTGMFHCTEAISSISLIENDLVKQLNFAKNNSKNDIPMQISQSGCPVWKTSQDAPNEYPEITTQLEMQTILGIPITSHAKCTSVMLFFSKQALAPSSSMPDLFTEIGRQIGALAELHHTTEQYLQDNIRTEAFLNAIPDMIFRISSDGRFIDHRGLVPPNSIFVDDPMIGGHLSDIFPSEIAYKTWAGIKETLRTGKIQIFEHPLTSPDTTQSFEFRLIASGKDEVLMIIRNISDRVKLEMMKSDFINRASHELRTPLTTAILTAGLIQEGGSPEEIAEYWNILNTELERQRMLIEHLLMVGRIESGNLKIKLSSIVLNKVLQDAINSVKPLARTREISLQETIPISLPTIIGDSNNIQQVFVNLLSNAIKFSEPASVVEIIAAMKDSNENADGEKIPGVSIWVRDHGIGIPQEDIPHLFTRFFRAQNAIDQEITGSGVGLYIVKSIIDGLGGNIKVESVINQGTTFEIWLPVQISKSI